MLLQEVRAAALRTRLRHRLIRRSEIALGIIRATVERVAATTRLLLHQLAIGALRALHADVILLDVFALRIAAAGDELAITSVAQHHVAPALGTQLFQGNVRHALTLIEPPRGPAIRIAGAGHELAKTSALEHHYPPAVLAILLLRGLRHLRRIELRQVDRVLLGEGAALRIILFIGATRVERTVLAPLQDQRRAAPLALLFGRLLHPLDVFHVLLGIAEVFLELFVELAQRVRPLLFAFLYFIQLFFQARRVLKVENVRSEE